MNATHIDAVQFPGPRLDDTLSPRFEVGCRLADGWGDLLIGYRFLNTQGGGGVDTAFGPGQNTGRLALNAFDFAYASQEFSLGPDWDMRWRIGVRSTILYYDARLGLAQPGVDHGLLLTNQREVNYFWGLGPWAGLELSRKTMVPGFAVFGRLEDSLQFGHITQTGVEDFLGNPEARNKVGFEVTVLTLTEEVGVSYTAPSGTTADFCSAITSRRTFRRDGSTSRCPADNSTSRGCSSAPSSSSEPPENLPRGRICRPTGRAFAKLSPYRLCHSPHLHSTIEQASSFSVQVKCRGGAPVASASCLDS